MSKVRVGPKPRVHGVRKGDPAGKLMKEKGVSCPCWECLRRVGITPSKKYAQYHKDIFGNEYNVANGHVQKVSKKELVMAEKAGRGLRKEAT